MPQFDFFIWFSLSLGTILTFQTLYYLFLYYILAPFSNFQKTLIKLYHLKQLRKSLQTLSSFFDYIMFIYFKNIRLKSKMENAVVVPQVKNTKVVVPVVKKTSTTFQTRNTLIKNIFNKNFPVIIIKKIKKARPLFITKKDLILNTIGNLLHIKVLKVLVFSRGKIRNLSTNSTKSKKLSKTLVSKVLKTKPKLITKVVETGRMPTLLRKVSDIRLKLLNKKSKKVKKVAIHKTRIKLNIYRIRISKLSISKLEKLKIRRSALKASIPQLSVSEITKSKTSTLKAGTSKKNKNKK